MLQVARLAPKLLDDSTALILSYLQSEQQDGVFRDRSGNPDLYYTVFGLECLRALSAPLPEGTAAFLRSYGDGADLDLVHASSLIRCWANVERQPPANAEALARSIERFRTPDGGYGLTGSGTVYGCFLALGAYQDLRIEVPDRPAMLACIDGLRAGDGAYSNQPGTPFGQTSSTAAAVGLLRHLGQPAAESLRSWFQQVQHPAGGFLAAPAAPIPDLLSTATALHALVSLRAPLDPFREVTLDFLDSLWTTRGGFLGSWADETLDCEYTYYGLLALGYLSL